MPWQGLGRTEKGPMGENNTAEKQKGRGITALMAWALSFGCMIGWGAFVMPGTTFLPGAGPVGSGIAILGGMAFAMLIAANYYFMMNRQSEAGGAIAYADEALGADQSFLCAWYLLLAYLSVVPLNTSALSFIARRLIYDNAIFSLMLAIVILGLCVVFCLVKPRLAGILQSILVLLLFVGVLIFFGMAIFEPKVMEGHMEPGFYPEGSRLTQTLMVTAIMPWAYIGFDTLSHMADLFEFDMKKTFRIMARSIGAAAVTYLILTVIPAAVMSGEYGSWVTYLEEMGDFTGIRTIPAFYSAEILFGRTGVAILIFAAVSAILSCLIGFCMASGRLLSAMAEKDFLPAVFKKRRASAIFIMSLTVILLVSGEAVSEQLVDLCAIGASVGFFYTSVAVFKKAREEKNKRYMGTGALGMLFSAVFGLYEFYFMLLNAYVGGLNSFLLLVFVFLYTVSALILIYHSSVRREDRLNQKRLEAEEKIREEGRFIYSMAHDLRTPMNAVMGFSDLALSSGDDPEKIRDHLEKIKDSAGQLLSLINDILEMGRMDSGDIQLNEEAHDLRDVVDEACAMAESRAEEKKLRFTVDTSRVESGIVFLDREKILRILLDLISNAIKFTPEGGRVEVTLAQEGKSQKPDYGRYVLHVKDTGKGMTKDFAEGMFDVFEMERASGTGLMHVSGLGVAVARNLVDMMEGTITVDTAPGEGSDFEVVLELKIQEDAGSGAALHRHDPAAASLSFKGRRVLIADDNLVSREIAREILVEHGFKVEEAENGRQALEKVSGSEPGYFDLVLMDVRMPVMGGYEATAAIRLLEDPVLSNVPVVALTANAFEEDVRAAKSAGMDGHIAKPVDIPLMMETLNKVFAEGKSK